MKEQLIIKKITVRAASGQTIERAIKAAIIKNIEEGVPIIIIHNSREVMIDLSIVIKNKIKEIEKYKIKGS